MKISKIACATLLGAIIATGAFADDAKAERKQYNTEKTKLEKSQIAEKEITSALQELKKYVGYLKDYDPALKENNKGNAKIIGELIERINRARKELKHVGDKVEYPNSNGGNKNYIEYDDGKGNKVKLTKGGKKVQIVIANKEKGEVKDFTLESQTKENFSKLFDGTNNDIVNNLIDGFIQEFHKAVEVREDFVVEQEVKYLDKINKNEVKTFYKDDIEAIRSIYKDLPRELKETADALGTNHKLKIGNNSADKAVELTIKDAKHAKELFDAVATLRINGIPLEHAKAAAKVLMDAGVKLKEGKDLSKISDVSQVTKALDIKEFDKVSGKFEKDKKVKEATQALLIKDLLFDFNENNKLTADLHKTREAKKGKLTKALEKKENNVNKFTKQVAKNNKQDDKKITLSDDPKKLAEQKRALDEIKKVLDGAAKDYDATKDSPDAEKKKAFDEALAKAKEAGVVIANAEDKKAESLKVKIEAALEVFKGQNNHDQIKKVVDAQQAFEVALQAYHDSVSLRVDAIIKNPKNSLSSVAKNIISSLADITDSNVKALATLSLFDKELLLKAIKANETSIQSATNEIGKVSNLDMVNFSSQLSTQTRLAKLSNPFNEDLALASAINKLSNDKFADNGDSVSSIIKSYTDRFNNDNNIWANVIGAKGKVKDSSNPELHGFSIGYDRAFDNTIVGGYMTLAKSKADSKLINTKASNYQFGLYARTYIDNSEIDTRVSFGKAKNKIQRNAILENRALTQDGKYDTTYTSFAVDYGYVMNLSDSLFVKPLVGLDYSHSKSKAFKESGDLPLSFNGVTSKSLNAKLALEFRKYVDDGNYLYITPGFEAEVYKDVKDPVARFVGSSKDIKLKADDKKGRFATLKTGAELKLTDSLSTNINFGVKAKSKQQYFDGTVGLKYKF
ncbi:autotransporter domain protein [Campylobacter pinnipediorum subsp. pinnipediorum]|uniref:autotransporter outer membrane beta-barrel domain-containing protein n=1 Tax=Campylobacter pinnipediorum TaxID=1965231 RepID=UPI0009C3C313|nr:autotransporter outer membrane beta-barrel domain-containing protein [Campylobacter pinnipediorum]AQW84659.1 autotransporter domain protein [Campylobacter pinnipediorum subsp. pinnipediorum]